MKRYIFITLKVLLISLLIFSVFRLASLGAGLVREQKRFEALASEVSDYSVPDTGDAEMVPLPQNSVEKVQDIQKEITKEAVNKIKETGNGTESRIKVNEERFRPLTEANKDFAGWIHIDGTVIDYPVMWTPDDPDYYLKKDFEKNDSKCGTPYIGRNCSTESNNIIIYAHNMKNGTMFSGLLNYKDEDFFKSHSTVLFDTPDESGIYDIISVFRDKVHYKDETGVFRYYEYVGNLTEDQYREYVDEVKERSLYETGNTAVYGQQLLTLSTCSYHTENGRFVVVAAKK